MANGRQQLEGKAKVIRQFKRNRKQVGKFDIQRRQVDK
jgi:hypothetical protein